jgi:hypothetical protein
MDIIQREIRNMTLLQLLKKARREFDELGVITSETNKRLMERGVSAPTLEQQWAQSA